MEWLNYHHLLYFWKVATEGSIARAAEELKLAPPTISAQIRSLEESLGEPLFHRKGRKLVLTEEGHTVLAYAEEIFGLGQEMVSVVRRGPRGSGPLRLNVGISDAVAKLVVREILKPAFSLEQSVHVVCREGSDSRLLAELAAYRLDIVLSDKPSSGVVQVKTFDHQLGECGLTFFAPEQLAAELAPGFPRSLDGAPAMLPTRNTAMRRSLERWFDAQDVLPRVVAEFEDTALLMVFAPDELGFFAVPSVIGDEIGRRYAVEPIGSAEGCRERFFAISAERKLKHPAVVSITEAARASLFAD